ncbi:hypothetical protein QSV37_17885 [Acinetobacter sp. VNK23]|uniref:hypothetical protein n=1 Tax=Acinetobacter thutiue TaxID=2998078 RepID=UPI0025769958|nr:hypothetical protein [Acinetobacter thutiue]MDM1022144.1 hypothetical protein [Acinetobacter thutiue]
MLTKVEINIEEIRRVYLLVEKMNEFFHQPDNYNQVDSFSKQIYPELSEVYYHIIWEWLPKEVRNEIEEE